MAISPTNSYISRTPLIISRYCEKYPERMKGMPNTHTQIPNAHTHIRTHLHNRTTCIPVLLFIFDLKPHVYYNCTVHSNEVVVMLDRLQLLEDRYEKLNELLSDPDRSE